MTRTRIALAAGLSVAALAVGAGVASAADHGHHDGRAHAHALVEHVRTEAAHAARGGPGLEPVAAYLGLTTDQIRADLAQGQSLAQIANATPGKSADGLVAALVADAQTKLDALVTAGKLTSTQESALLAKLDTAITTLVNRTPKPKPAREDMGHVLAGALKAASDYLGIPPGTLRADLKSGKTLGQIADATPGKSSAGLVSALVADVKTRLDAAVANGMISSTQEAAILAALPPLVGAVVNG